MPRDVATDQIGNVYITGGTRSLNFPTTAGAYKRTFNGAGGQKMDVFVSKLSPTGSLIWSTYIGGPNYDRAYAIEVDPFGSIVIAGRASGGMPVSATAFQRTFMGGTLPNGAYGQQDGFVCKIAPTGASVTWCSYFGVSDAGILRDVAVDRNGDIFVAGGTTQGGFPASWFVNAPQRTKAGGQDLILAKISSDGTRVLWATYLGGSGDEGMSPSVRIDPQGNPIVLTDTSSPDMRLVNAADRTLNGVSDMYVAKVSADGRSILYSTYLGGSGGESSETHGLAIDQTGNAFVAAGSTSRDLAVTANAYQRTSGGLADVMLAKLSPTGALLGMTYIGGPGGDNAEGIATNSVGEVFVTFSSNGSFAGAANLGTGGDMVGAKLSPDLSRLIYSRRLGGIRREQARAASPDGVGGFLMLAQTESPGISLVTPFQSLFRGVIDVLVARVSP